MSDIGTKMKIETIREVRRRALAKDPARAAGEAALVRLATRLYEVRTSMKLTQEELAERSGLDQASISDIENGDANPTVRTLGRIAAGLGMGASALLEHGPIAVQYGSTVNLLEGVKWQGPSVQATTLSWSYRRPEPTQFKKIKLARARKIGTG